MLFRTAALCFSSINTRAFHGLDHCSRVGPGQGGPTRPVRFGTPPDPTRLDPRDFESILTRPAGRVVASEKNVINIVVFALLSPAPSPYPNSDTGRHSGLLFPPSMTDSTIDSPPPQPAIFFNEGFTTARHEEERRMKT